jgi:pyruvate/2-oxoglutarate dehydrogenase complex dihydrolipoamide dehydrogenase (E3) component
MATNKPNVFAAGDATPGAMTVVDAIAGGHRAARAIHSALSGELLPAPKKRAKTRVPVQVMTQLEETADEERPPVEVTKIPDAYRRSGFSEVEGGFSLPAACREASRCLHCDYVMVEDEA